jgi:hypothetical protein
VDVTTQGVVIDIRQRMQQSPNKSIRKLLAQIGLLATKLFDASITTFSFITGISYVKNF